MMLARGQFGDGRKAAGKVTIAGPVAVDAALNSHFTHEYPGVQGIISERSQSKLQAGDEEFFAIIQSRIGS